MVVRRSGDRRIGQRELRSDNATVTAIPNKQPLSLLRLNGGQLRTRPELTKRLLHKTARVGPRRCYLLQLAAGARWTSLPFLTLIRQPILV